MDPFEKIERITQILIAQKEREMQQAKDDGKSVQYIAEIYCHLSGLKSIQNKIHDIKDNRYSVSDAEIDKDWNSKASTLAGE